MTTTSNPPTTPNPRSLRFSLDEVLSGMLATLEGDHFTDDSTKLAASFEDLAGKFPLFANFAGALDPQAVGNALAKLESKSHLRHDTGQYKVTAEGRAHCVSSKRTLFNREAVLQLEDACRSFEAQTATTP